MRQFLLLLFMGCVGCLPMQADDFVNGADISWCTEMEADGKKFYNKDSEERDIFVLMKEIGMTAIRLRVWVDPETYGYGAWCDKADVVAKAKRAAAQGLDVMIDFHYSDFFADPGTQTCPTPWKNMTTDEVKAALAAHTKDVLQALKAEGVAPKWVQVGNETNMGMVWDYGYVDWNASDPFAKYTVLSNAGYDAVKEVFPDAYVIVHRGTIKDAVWNFSEMQTVGLKYDMIGLSVYPSADEWNSTSSSAYQSNVTAAKTVSSLISTCGVPVMICETGFDVTQPALGLQVMEDLFTRMQAIDQCAGIFYWEPEVDNTWKPAYYEEVGWGAYGMGAFTADGKPTRVLNAFGNGTAAYVYPDELALYGEVDGKTTWDKVGTLLPVSGKDGEYYGVISIPEGYYSFNFVDESSDTWYGCAPNQQFTLSVASDKWNPWFDSAEIGEYGVTANLADMTWSYLTPSGIDDVTVDSNAPIKWYDIQGNQIQHPSRKGVYIQKQGDSTRKVYAGDR